MKKVIVTGATRGIGKAIALRLAADGFEVIGTGRTRENFFDADRIQFMPVDFSESSSVACFLNEIEGQKILYVVNNAGINLPSPTESFPLEDYDKMMRVNLRVPFELIRCVLPSMKSCGFGRIVNIASIWGVVGKELRAPYCATKFGLDGMTTALAAEVAKYNILANCISPGFVKTEATLEAFSEDELDEWAKLIPIRRLAKSSEIASLVSWLISDQNSYISGQNIVIDGGLTRV